MLGADVLNGVCLSLLGGSQRVWRPSADSTVFLLAVSEQD